ncbi:proton-coupled folate transporter-like [Culex pipiens pallens]|uniref:proton-coupled folate transporter-like n=1 Tax=Culex pipiens pallens TaxID=42434 RepID=UPI0019540DFE|nr:proton-coupled folate transporter-like [Culex pipiens pallens]
MDCSDDEQVLSPAVVQPVRRGRSSNLEIPVFLLFYAWNVSTPVLTDQIIYQACTVSLAANVSDCAKLGHEHESPEVLDLEARVQPYTADILMVEALSDSILPAALNLFIGPWSDRYGRKPVLLLTFSGFALSLAMITAFCGWSRWYPLDPWIYTFAFIPSALSGSVCTLMSTVYCYIADVTSERERGAKMALLDTSLYGGMLAGSLSSSYILRKTNATTVFAIAAGAVFLAVLHVALRVRESVHIRRHRVDVGCCTKLRHLFRLDMVVDTVRTCFQWRPHYDRAIILLGVVALGGNIFALEDTHTVFFLFLRKHFNWSVRKYTFYSATETVCMILGALLGTYGLRKVLGLTEAAIAAVGFFCCFLNAIAIAEAIQSWQLYLALFLFMLKGVADPMTRAFISNSTPPEDNGKIFAFTSSFEALMPLGAAPLYTYLYKNTLSWYPGAFSWISAGVFAMCYCLAITVCILRSMSGDSL